MSTTQRDTDVQLYGEIPNTAIRTRSGHLFDVLDDSTWQFDETDIVTALSNLCRFNGHVRFYSVAEHSLRVGRLLWEQTGDPMLARLGLWHDAAEAYIGDIVSPHKRVMTLGGMSMKKVELNLERAIWNWLGIDVLAGMWERVMQADADVYALEAPERPFCGNGYVPGQVALLFTNFDQRMKREALARATAD